MITISKAIREGLPTDRDFIIATWLKSLRNPPTFIKEIPVGIWTRNKGPEIESILENSNVFVTCDREVTDQIYGYMVVDKKFPVIHYIYVKKVFRNIGVAKDMLNVYQQFNIKDETACAISHITKDFMDCFYKGPKKYRKFYYNPFITKELGYEISKDETS